MYEMEPNMLFYSFGRNHQVVYNVDSGNNLPTKCTHGDNLELRGVNRLINMCTALTTITMTLK